MFIQKGKRQWQSNTHSEPPNVLDSAVLWISNFLYFGLTALIPKTGSPQPSKLYHAVHLLPYDHFSKPNSSVLAPLPRIQALKHIIPRVSWSQWLSQRTCCYLLNYPAMTARPNAGSNHHLDCFYLQLLEAHQEISLIFLIKHDDHGSAELMILHPLNNPRQWQRSEMLCALVWAADGTTF